MDQGSHRRSPTYDSLTTPHTRTCLTEITNSLLKWSQGGGQGGGQGGTWCLVLWLGVQGGQAETGCKPTEWVGDDCP